MKRQSISTKVSLVLFIVIAVVLFVAAMVININTKNIMTENIQKEVSIESKSVSNQVNHFFEKKGQLVDQITTNPSVLRYLEWAGSRDKARTNRYYKNVVQSLDAIKEMDSDVAMVWVASEKGNFLMGTGNVLSAPDFNLSERPWYKPVTNAEGVYYTDPYMDQVFGKVILSVMKEVRIGDDGIGIVAIDIFLDSIPSIMEQYKMGKSGYSILMAPDGKVIYHPDEKQVMKDSLTKQKGDIGTIAKKMIAGKSGLQEAEIDAKQYYVGYEPVKSTGWSVATAVTQDEVFLPLKSMTKNLIIYFSVTVLILVIITYLLLKYMLKNLSGMSKIINKIATGDLTYRLDVKSNDELGHVAKDLNNMLDHLQELIRIVQDDSKQVAASSEELNISADQTAQAAQLVATSVGTVTEGSMQQTNNTKAAAETVVTMSETIQLVSADSDRVAKSSEEAVQKAKLGEDAIVSAMTQMEKINETVNAAADMIERLGERSKEIDQIVEVISAISNQTNLLALNASIEAARAGEQGRGFAVVADEVKKLAEQSNYAAGQIGELIKQIQSDTATAVNSITSGTYEVKKGSDVVQTAGVKFTEITGITSKVSQQMNAISSSIRELSSGTSKIVAMIQNVDGLADSARESFEQVAAAVEEQTATLGEIALSSQELSTMASDLQEAVAKFKI
nr:methyl-accepting chemotaxis protein [Bacillus rubiinfantis]